MNAIHRSVVTLALLAASLLPRHAAAGANETPGENHRPHTFSSYTPVTTEFGGADVAIFQAIVVGSQHYSQGAAYTDNGSDEQIGSAGLWNFFQFCTNRSADVMLVASHGYNNPRTLIESYAPTVRGKAIRDSILAYYNGIFAPGSFTGVDNAKRYGIQATQTFYTTYFQTPQAFCWWATCWSSLLSMTGPAEARCYLGYNEVVQSSKCNCDQNTVLKRMDGQEGQAKRPLAAALAGINGTCVDPKASLIATGKLNTVLSPSVLDYSPKGIVCSSVPGFVYFDCSLETRIAPAAVVSASGDGFLANHMWAGNDRVTFDVIPTKPCPTIFYDVHEHTSISVADYARLDGNTVPAVNALGPNQDDFIWSTFCPGCPIPIWYSLLTTTVNDLSVVPGTNFFVYTPVSNMTGSTYSGTVSLHVDGITLPVETVPLTLTGGQSSLLTWLVPIPSSALPGQTYGAHLTVAPNGETPYLVDDFIHVGQTVFAEPQPDMSDQSHWRVKLLNQSALSWPMTGLTVSDDQGWTTGISPTSLTLAPFASATVEIAVSIPPSTPNGTVDHVTVSGNGPNGPFSLSLGPIDGFPDPFRFGLPVEVRLRSLVDFVPGSNDARINVDVVSHADHPIAPSYLVQSSHGFSMIQNLPLTLQPNVPATGYVQVSIPADTGLVNKTDVLTFQIFAEGYDVSQDLSLKITPAIEIDVTSLLATKLYTGWASPHPFPSSLVVRNHADLPMFGGFNINSGVQISPPGGTFNIPPNGTQTIPIQAIVPPNLPSGVYLLSVVANASNPIGSTRTDTELRVTQPVLIRFQDRANWTIAGQPDSVIADLINLRPDRGWSGFGLWGDMSPWYTGNPSTSYSLPPGGTQTVKLLIQAPPLGFATADTATASLTLDLTYETGMTSSTRSDIDIVAIRSGTTSVPGSTGGLFGTMLESIDPNPSAANMEVRFRLAIAGRAAITVHDATGRLVATLAEGTFAAGPHRASWNGRKDDGTRAGVGVYFIRLQSRDVTQSKKAILMR